MIINDVEIAPGEEKNVVVNIARLPSHSPIDISITISRSKQDGPVLLLSGGMHGDEINGIEIVRRIVTGGYNRPAIGTTICIPIINIFGFIHFSRYVPDGKDVNRSFPGNRNGSLASRIAHYLTHDILPKIDYGIDFHTGGADRTNYPQVRCLISGEQNSKLAEVFNAPFTLDAKHRPNSLRRTAAKLGKPIIVYEGGESSRFDQFAIDKGIDGTLRVMKFLGMLSEAPETREPSRIIKKSTWIRARKSGIFHSSVKYGESIKKGQEVGSISDPFGEYSTVLKASGSGFIIGLNHNPIVHQGDALMHIGISN